jgi:superfamily I DNA/RNA helicase
MDASPVAMEVTEQRIDPGEWDDAVVETDGPQIVVGGPGSGKTEFLVRRALHLVLDRGERSDGLLVVSFGRRGVADLRTRIRRGLDRPVAPVPVVTFHSLAADILELAGPAVGWASPPQILTGPEQTRLVRRLLATEQRSAWSPAFRGLLDTGTLADEITDFVLRASEQLLTVDDLEALAADRADWRALPAFVDRYRRNLRELGRIDYGMLLADAVAAVETGAARALRHRYVLVDEYQDTTVSQARLLAALAAPDRNLTAAADPYQSIYSFRGATVQNVARFPDEFRDTTGAPARRLVLTTSFRTPAAILDAAERVTAQAIPGASGPVEPAQGKGRVDVHVFDQQTAESEWIAGELLRIHLQEQVPFGRMAVFVRSKRRFLPELSRALQRRNIPHDEPGARLSEQPAVRFVLDLVAAAVENEGSDRLRHLRRVLLGPWFGMPLGTLRDLERTVRSGGRGWADALRAHHRDLRPLARLLEDETWASRLPASQGVWRVWSSLPQLGAVAREEHRRAERAAWASLTQVVDRWNLRNPTATLVDYRRQLLDEAFEAQPLLSYTAPDEDHLTVTTLHQAKGLEFDVVFIADAVEGVFPDLRSRDSLLGVRHLLPDVPHEPGPYQRFRLQEERRLAYTAMTRAAQRVVWTATSTGFEEGRGIPSRFLALVAGTGSVDDAMQPVTIHGPPVTLAEAEAALRRVVGDPTEPGPRRAAAVQMLAAGSRHGLRDPWTFNGLRDRGPDEGVMTLPLRLSPSQADLYMGCPRRYVLQRRLGIGDVTGLHAEVGRLVHAVMEAAGRTAMARGDVRSTRQDALDALDDLFDPGAFGGEPYATAWRTRARVSIDKLYDHWPSDGMIVDVERRLEMRFAGVDWLGFADRIELRPEGLTVVDYKTSGSMPTRAEAAESLQLGFYLLAVATDEELTSRYGDPAAAEFWYPYASRRNKSVSTRDFDLANLPAVEERLTAAATGIAAEDWPPAPSDGCERCPVRSICPAQPDGAEGFVA